MKHLFDYCQSPNIGYKLSVASSFYPMGKLTLWKSNGFPEDGPIIPNIIPALLETSSKQLLYCLIISS